MSRKRARTKIDIEGLVCYTDDDPLAEVSIVTDFGHELLVDPSGPMTSPFHWLDCFVHAQGQMVRRAGRRYLRIDRINRVPNVWAEGVVMEEELDWQGDGSRWDDDEDEHEGYY